MKYGFTTEYICCNTCLKSLQDFLHQPEIVKYFSSILVQRSTVEGVMKSEYEDNITAILTKEVITPLSKGILCHNLNVWSFRGNSMNHFHVLGKSPEIPSKGTAFSKNCHVLKFIEEESKRQRLQYLKEKEQTIESKALHFGWGK